MEQWVIWYDYGQRGYCNSTSLVTHVTRMRGLLVVLLHSYHFQRKLATGTLEAIAMVSSFQVDFGSVKNKIRKYRCQLRYKELLVV